MGLRAPTWPCWTHLGHLVSIFGPCRLFWDPFRKVFDQIWGYFGGQVGDFWGQVGYLGCLSLPGPAPPPNRHTHTHTHTQDTMRGHAEQVSTTALELPATHTELKLAS